MTGTTLFTVSRLLSEWEERDIIRREQKVIVIENRAALIEMGEQSEELLPPRSS
jgi:hypothetical protein